MADGGNPDRLLEVLARRRELLAELAPGPRSKGDLVGALSASRSTVGRALGNLEEVGVVERRDDGYALTLAGRLLLERFDRLAATVVDVVGAGDLLGALPAEAPVDERLLRGAAVYRSGDGAPAGTADLVGRAHRFRGFVPAVAGPRFPRLDDRVRAGLDAELLCEADAVAEVAGDAAGNGPVGSGLRLLRTGSLPFGLLLTEDAGGTHVRVTVYDDGGDPAGVIHNDTPAAAEWARECYERHREAATDVTGEFAPTG